MELNTDVIEIVNKNHERFLEEQEKLAREEQQKKLIEKNQSCEKLKRSLVMLGIGFILGAAPTASAIIDGHNEIVSEFDDATSEYEVRKYSNEYQINHGNIYVNLEHGINGMIDAARDKGMNDVEIAIGLNSLISSDMTKKYINTSLEDRCNQCINKHEAKKLGGEYKNGK